MLFSCEASSSSSLKDWRCAEGPFDFAQGFGSRLPLVANGDSLTPAKRLKFSVIIPRGYHPFPSRTRKLSPAGPIVLHAKVCGRVRNNSGN